MVNGKQFEHTHRLVASAVATMTFVLCAMIFERRRADRVLTRLGVAAAVLVVVQALLGAWTVKLALPAWVSSLHLATAMAFFCTTVTLAFLTRQRLAGSSPGRVDAKNQNRLRRWILPAIAITYLQVCVGAVMRHTRAGLACGFDFPLCLGQIWPRDAHLGVKVHMVHRAGACLTAAVVIALAGTIFHREKGRRALRIVVTLGAVAVLVQVALGIATIFTARELVTMTLHSSLGAALLACLVAVYWIACPSAPPGTPYASIANVGTRCRVSGTEIAPSAERNR